MNDIIYADVPKDLMKIKTKFLFNLTKRQLCCFGGGALVGVPLYFLTRDALPRTVSMLLMIGVMTIEARFRRSKKRPFKTNNLYTALHKQADFDKEVKAIVRASVQKKRKAGNTPA